MITGGTGFIGLHTARALMAAGHRVRLLARDKDKLRRLYGSNITDYVLGDVTDPAAVSKALDGCDAVVHSAAMVSVDQKDADKVMATNLGGTELVVGGAAERGFRCIIHVSSVTALYDPRARFLNEFSPPGSAANPYAHSKVACENFVRDLQAQGLPVHITYPASVIGPDDPGFTAPHQGLRSYLGSAAPVLPSGNQWVDVRDVAAAHLALLDREPPPGRYPLGGHFLTWSEFVDTLSRVTGRRIQKVQVPGGVMLGLGRLADWVSRLRGKSLDIPVTHEAMVYATNWVRMDNSKTVAELGVQFRPIEETLADTIRYLAEEGLIAVSQAGSLYRDDA
ncbi:MAG: SDR family NAD(P)-dependent oxidoreductase [Halieaceae bacterium]|jgi:nucleoside-diphosphate-sugar epimerase|nr:SDR family NAD(P)-dependent oxidoreductase [Halieaceae bacterium]